MLEKNMLAWLLIIFQFLFSPEAFFLVLSHKIDFSSTLVLVHKKAHHFCSRFH